MSEKEKGCCWHFANKSGGVDDGPNNAMQDNFKQMPYASLIRESIQNSLDAICDSNRPVRVEYTSGSIAKSDFPCLMDLESHVQGCIDFYGDKAEEVYGGMLRSLKHMDSHIPYIKVSDYNTKGMDYMKDNQSNPFYSFVYAKGVSQKSNESSGGSYGYGKAAFYNISPLQTILVSTRTTGGRCLFEGIALLCTHKVDGVKKEAVGYYDNNGGHVIDDEGNIPEPFRRNEPGTDIYILGVSDNNMQDEVIKATLRNFWLAVEWGKLEVTIDNIVDINRETLRGHMEHYMTMENDKPNSDEEKYNPRPYWEAVRYVGIDNRQYRHIKRRLPTLGHVNLYVKLAKGAPDKIVYMRKLLMFVYAKKEQSENGFYGVFVCDDEQGNAYLRRMENAAHNKWDYRNWKTSSEDGVKRDNPLGKKVMEEIKQFIKEAKGELFGDRQRDTQEIVGLNELCYIPYGLDDDGETYINALAGQPHDNPSEEGGMLTVEVVNGGGGALPVNIPGTQGKVMVKHNGSGRYKESDNGGLVAGRGSGRPAREKGGGASSSQIDSHVSDDDNGINGVAYSEIPVKYRSYAVNRTGRTVHILVIHSNCDITNGRVDLLVGGEQSNDKIPICQCSAGTARENRIIGLQIYKGKNVLEVQFVDNMRHAIILNAYEAR